MAPTVLLIDDDPVSLTLMQRILERAGYRAVMAADANHGLALLERASPALLVVDLMLPLQSGFHLIEKLRRCPLVPPRIMVVTASEEERLEAHARELGVDAYLRKPLHAEAFLAEVQRLCPMVVPADTPGVVR
ncbi:MAG: response regulator [Gemmataceae bacterium]|nr:response regulator [Gemmataceae bacterium]MDW8266282.1 response regulator [Gemmataceae bacterium]